MSEKIAVVKWGLQDALASAIRDELVKSGYQTVPFLFDQPIPEDIGTVFSFAPYGRWMQIPYALSKRPRDSRPRLVHWNTENPPDLNLPWGLTRLIGAARTRVDLLHEAADPRARRWVQQPPLKWIDQRLMKFRYIGEVHYAAHRGWLNLYVESSEIYADLHRRHGVPAQVVPWATVPEWCADLGLERDIDVLWFGQRRSARRSRLLDRLRGELKARGIEIYIADGVEKPFVHGAARTHLLNRAKVTLNLLPTWYDNAFPYRFHVAAGNRSLVITEPTLKHSSCYTEGEHYVSAPVEQLADKIAYYVRDKSERGALTQNAYGLVMTRMTMGDSVRAIMSALEASPHAA